MTDPGRDRPTWEQRSSQAFVALADTLVAGFDITTHVTMLSQRCTDLLAADTAAVLLRGPHGDLRLAATAGHRADLLARFVETTGDGPHLDCDRSGEPVSCLDLATERARWPRFRTAAVGYGFHAAHTLPMRLRDRTIGVVLLLNTAPRAVDAAWLGQALADVATVGILQQRTIDQGRQVAAQLETALTSRIIIEQAKGVLAEHGNVSMDEAFDQLRGYARSHQQRLATLAHLVAAGTADLGAILAHQRR
ncbi:transcriptional regulator [Actinocatenispora thailandica]|uniref:Transcriptional regulator n=1 Tax=Actinocatenispora thailandica TaxID=227318 RepID=A0A7R7DWY8_9ACTN|nr:GAF and ANTAR domain-containing protein [Actinocatenispora thailandica]BCJ39279.1 transcriptional regulator [Actinocatenispora thailandica]